jgi:hypothetical protein
LQAWVFLAAVLVCAPSLLAASASIEVQAVAASDAGKEKELNLPAALDSHKNVLKHSGFKTFKDAGRQSVKINEGEKGTVRVGAYTLEFGVTKVDDGKCKVALTVKDGDKAIGAPAAATLAIGKPMQMQVGSADAPTILIINLRETK